MKNQDQAKQLRNHPDFLTQIFDRKDLIEEYQTSEELRNTFTYTQEATSSENKELAKIASELQK